MINTTKKYPNSGVYKIISPSGKIYIGATIDLIRRKNEYKNLRCKRQPKLYYSLSKYGWNNHTWEEEKFTYDILNEIEVRYKKQVITSLGWEKALFCKIHDNGGGPFSEDIREKMSQAGKGKKKPKEMGVKLSKKLKGRNITWGHKLGGKNTPRTKTRKPVIQYDLENNIIKHFPSIKAAEIELSGDPKKDNIGACCRGKQQSAYGYKWSYINEELD